MGDGCPPSQQRKLIPNVHAGPEKGQDTTQPQSSPPSTAAPLPEWGGSWPPRGPPRPGCRCVLWGSGEALPPSFYRRLEGRCGAGAERAGGARGPVGARPAAEPLREQHDRAVPLLPALGTARSACTVRVPGGTGGERDSSAVGPGSGVSERS